MTAYAHDNTWTARGDHRPTRENRVSRRSPCAWCGNTKYCLQFDDGGSFCRTVGEADQWTDAFMGGYLHRPTDATTLATPPARAKAPEVEAAAPEMQHTIYTELLAWCPLSDAHRTLLTGPGHGLADEQASTYGTLPVDATARREIVNALVDAHGTAALLRTPGFVLTDTGRIALAPLAGILMPRRDLPGHITGFMVRSDKPDADPRYLWLSSAATGGPSSGSAPHVARPAGGVRIPHEVYIVEGIKKADLLAERMGCLAISINGVGTWRAAEEILDELAGQGVDVCVIALDRDVKPSAIEHVERSRQRLAAAAAARGYAVRVASWDKDVAKGPDDLLLAGHTFNIERYRPATADRRDDDTSPITGVAPATDGNGWVSVDPQLMALLIEKAMATDTLRRKYQQQNLLITDKRIKPGDKVLTAAVWDMAMPEGRDPSPTAPRKIYRAALAERTGLSMGTITRKLQDANAMGLISCESRQTGPDNTELWVSVGRLPDKALTAAEVNALAQNRQKDRERKVCPHCGSAHLRPATYICMDCDQTCTDDEALAAGRETITMDSGAIVDAETGEILTPAPTRADSARGQTPRQNTVPEAPETPRADSARGQAAPSGSTPRDATEASSTPRADSAHPVSNVLRCAESARGTELLAARGPMVMDAPPSMPTERCATCKGTTYRWREKYQDWPCATCYPAPVKPSPPPLHIHGSTVGLARAGEGVNRGY